MKLVWHIVKKDLRRLRLPLALWALLLIAKGELGVRALASDGSMDRMIFLLVGENTLVLLGVLVNLLLVAAFVQEDSLVGMHMFWVTRPISGARLLAAKLLGAILMFGVLPVLLWLRWWLACGYGAVEITHAAVTTLDEQLLVTFPAMVLACLTPNVNRFLAWLLGAVVVVVTCLPLFGRATGKFFGEFQPETSAGVLQTRMILVGSVIVVTGVAVIVRQFCTRQTIRSVVWLAAGGLAATVLLYWPWDLSGAWPRSRPESLQAKRVNIAVAGMTEVQEPKNGRRREMRIDYVVRGVPEEFGLTASSVNRWRGENGDAISWFAPLQSAWPELATWRALGLPREKFRGLVHGWPPSISTGPIVENLEAQASMKFPVPIYLDENEVDRLRAAPAKFTSKWEVDFIRPILQLALPPRAGEKRTRDGYSLRVTATEVRDGLLFAHFVESRPVFGTRAQRRPGLSTLFGFAGRREEAIDHRVVNLTRGEAHRFSPSASEAIVGTQLVRGFGVALEPPAWMDGAMLEIIRDETVEHFHREVSVEKLTVTMSPASK